MLLLVTDTYTHLLREHPTVVANAAQARNAGEVVGTTVITKIEVLRGWFETLLKADERRRFLSAQHELSVAEEALQRTLVIPIDERAVDRFQYLKVTKGLRRVGRADLLIAAIVLSRDATVVTRNKKDFGLIPIELASWEGLLFVRLSPERTIVPGVRQLFVDYPIGFLAGWDPVRGRGLRPGAAAA